MKSSVFNEDIDSDAGGGYVISIYEEGEVVGLLVATTYKLAEELCELVLEEDEEETLDGLTILPVKFDTLNQHFTVH